LEGGTGLQGVSSNLNIGLPRPRQDVLLRAAKKVKILQDFCCCKYIEVGANTLKSSSTFQFPTKIMFS
jgi:hypothetical protein